MSSNRLIYRHLGRQLSPWNKGLHRADLIFSSLSLISTHARPGSAVTLRSFGTTLQAHGSNHPNPGNFANRPKEELKEIGRKGGQKGGRATGVGGFHDMDPDKQREIASKGGRASSGSFTKGSQSAREAGRKGGGLQKRPSSPSKEEYDEIFV